MSDVWRTLSALGDSRWLLPMALVLLFTLPAQTRLKWRWLLAIAVTAGITLASKLAFMGWGLASRACTSPASPGMRQCPALYPVVAGLLAGPGRRAQATGLMFGAILATAIAWSRVPLYAHTLSEVIAGLMLGLGCSAPALRTASKCPGEKPTTFRTHWLDAATEPPRPEHTSIGQGACQYARSPTMTIEER